MSWRSIKRAAAPAIAALFMFACGCTARAAEPLVSPPSAEGPSGGAEIEQEPGSLWQSRYEQRQSATVYFAMRGQKYLLGSELSEFYGSGDRTSEVELVNLALGDPRDDRLERVAPQGVRCISVEVSGDVACVNLSPEVWQADEYTRYMLRMAILYTLTEQSAIRWVSVLADGVAMPWQHLPVGPLSRENKDMLSIDQARLSEWERLQRPISDVPRNEYDVMLYFPDTTGQYLIPEVRKIQVIGLEGMDYIYAILDELSRGSVYPDERQRLFTPNVPIIYMNSGQDGVVSSGLSVDSSGIQSLRLVLTAYGVQYYSHSALSESVFYGAIGLSLMSFMPELSRFEVSVDTSPVTHMDGVPIGAGVARRFFEPMIGAPVNLYLPAADGNALVMRRHIMPQAGARNPESVLRALLGYTDASPAVAPVLPVKVQEPASMVMGVSTNGDTINVGLREEILAECEGLSLEKEQTVIYAIVNTMSDLPGIKRVRFYFGGKVHETLAGHMDIYDPLVKAPGLVIHR